MVVSAAISHGGRVTTTEMTTSIWSAVPPALGLAAERAKRSDTEAATTADAADMVQTTALCTVTHSAGATEHGVSAYAEQRKLSAAVSRQPDRKK